jgi:hypothetical protein
MSLSLSKITQNNNDVEFIAEHKVDYAVVSKVFSNLKSDDSYLIEASFLDENKRNWLTGSQVAHGMKLIKKTFNQFNILYRSLYINNNDKNFSLDNLLVDKSGNNVIKENSFFILHSRKNHWILLTNY